ncbi:MAG TPA: nuclear transport factor 2 family protein [Anaerolineales bacterium]|nr:nuclear transport factor 2 family protein [Anaerolineales bacterium]HLE73792.1 nuclear transport factor 2 family protein [Anaerolineales bacterium]
MKKTDFETWLAGYLQAWKSNKPQEIAKLFTEDALYSTGPFDDPWIGQEAIIDGWVGIGDRPEDWTFEYEVLAVDGDLGVMHGTTVYKEAGTFSNIWLIRLAKDGRCKEFREWFVRKRD